MRIKSIIRMWKMCAQVEKILLRLKIMRPSCNCNYKKYYPTFWSTQGNMFHNEPIFLEHVYAAESVAKRWLVKFFSAKSFSLAVQRDKGSKIMSIKLSTQ